MIEKAQKNIHVLRIGRLGVLWEKLTDGMGIPALHPLEFQVISHHLFIHRIVEYFVDSQVPKVPG